MKQRLVIVDDSPLIRTMLRDMLGSDPSIEVVGIAKDGQEGISMIQKLKPDVVTMDVEMPVRNGLSALKEVMATQPTPVIMVSTLTYAGAEATVEALAAGAYDFVCKPNNGAIREFRTVRDELVVKIHAARGAKVHVQTAPPARVKALSATSDRVIVIASSTGGPRALSSLWGQWPKQLNVPILMVQHMPPGFTASLAARLNAMGSVPCREAKHGDSVECGVALMAPGGKHMRVDKNGLITLDEAPAIHGVRPAADYLFKSAVDAYGSKVVGAVLTGMGRDGAEGAKAIKDAGGVVFGEAESTCTVYGMPRAAKELGAIASEFSINELGQAIVAGLSRRLQNAS